MQTTCPHCWTIFKINADQVRHSRGMVVCGVCQKNFNASEYLLPEKTKTFNIDKISSIQAISPTINKNDTTANEITINQPPNNTISADNSQKTTSTPELIKSVLKTTSEKKRAKTFNIDNTLTSNLKMPVASYKFLPDLKVLITAFIIFVLIIFLWLQISTIIDNIPITNCDDKSLSCYINLILRN